MQKHYYRDIDGTLVDMSGYAPRLNWIAQSKAEEGTYGSWTVTLDDPNAELDILGHRQWFVEDDESEDEDDIIFGGFTGAQTFARLEGDQRRVYGPQARVITVELMDANSWFSKIIMRGSDANRTSIETDAERMAWLLATSEAALILDTSTFVNTSGARNMDEGDLRGTYVGQIIADCAGTSGKNHFLWYRKVSGVRTLTIWYGRDTLSTYPSPFFITNDRADLVQSEIEDGTAVIWPLSDDAKMKRSPEKQYCGNYATYGDKGAATYVHNADTHALIASYGSGHRDMTSNFPLIRKKTTAKTRAARQLLDVQDQEIRVTTTLKNVPSTRVTLAKAGMRLEVKGTHWSPTLDDWHYARIVSAQPRPHSKGDLYDIELELSIPSSISSPGPTGPPESTGGAIMHAPGASSDPDTTFPIHWASDGDNPGLGYGADPIDAASFDYTGSIGTRTGFEVLATSGNLDIYLQITFADVSETRTYTLELLLNGSPVASDSATKGAGFGFIGEFLIISVSGLAVVAGDLLSCRLTTSELSGQSIPWGTGDNSNKFEILPTSTVVP